MTEKFDTRYRAIEKKDERLLVLMRNEKIGKKEKVNVDFRLPSAPALFLNLARNSYETIKSKDIDKMFYKWNNSRTAVNHSELFDYFELFMSHVVFSFTAIEAFANETIPENYEYEKQSKDGLESKIIKKEEIERCVSIDEKLTKILPNALSLASPKGNKLWQDYVELKKIRDRIIHLKKIDYSSNSSEKNSIWGMMLRFSKKPYYDYSHKLIGYYLPSKNRRWHREFHNIKKEPDKLLGDN